ncbi:hypothetical protein [Citrobacter sp. CtB7.12]|nr:hypothetical protein [Citrobacter sp. CtB7.12]
MKRFIALALLCALSGCAHSPSSLSPAFSGQGEPVNTPKIIAELTRYE